MARKSERSWSGALFGLIFLLAGLAAAYGSGGMMVIGYIASANWVEVPVTINSLSLVSNRGDSTTYSVKSHYSYNFNGTDYQSDRVSLSRGNDNIGSYWQNLEKSLLADQRSNEAFALVNPKDPTKALLDRTLRWKSLVFASLFLLIFGGAGSLIMWASLRGGKNREERLQFEQKIGISSNQKTSGWYLAAFGGVFFVMGTGMSVIALPEAIRDRNYGALFLLLFVFVGLGIIFYAFKIMWAYRRFGPTPLFLDPSVPGVGGQLGGLFDIHFAGIGHAMASAIPLQATLTCTYKRKSGKRTSSSIEWQKEAPVHLKATAKGIQASFLFDIPDNCKTSQEWSHNESYSWDVMVGGDFSEIGFGEFERSWPVVVEHYGTQASNSLRIPQNLLETAQDKSEEFAKTSVLIDVPVTEDGQHITVTSRAGRHPLLKLFGILMGVIFAGAGTLLVMDNEWFGYLITLLGGLMVFFSLRSLGKSILVTIDKQSRMLNTRVGWFGISYASQEGDVREPEQFRIKQTSTSTTGSKVTEYYRLEFTAGDKKIRVAEGIEGKQEALALKQAIVERFF